MVPRDAQAEIKRLEGALQKVMARLADLLDADHFNNIEAIVLNAGVPCPPLADLRNWHSIEGAPKDRLIDIWTGDRRITDCWWDHVCSEWRSTGNSNHLICFKKATHWMYLPPAPAIDAHQDPK
jgi:hypothetical protein